VPFPVLCSNRVVSAASSHLCLGGSFGCKGGWPVGVVTEVGTHNLARQCGWAPRYDFADEEVAAFVRLELASDPCPYLARCRW
jgi:hypothetical protein